MVPQGGGRGKRPLVEQSGSCERVDRGECARRVGFGERGRLYPRGVSWTGRW